MNAPLPAGGRRGWCPTAHRPMPSGDGLLARVRPPAAALTADQARTVDEAAQRCGNGIVELTGRGNLQCRGLSAESFPRFLDAICAAGLADPDPVRDGRRRVMTAPLLGATATAPLCDAMATARLGEATTPRCDPTTTAPPPETTTAPPPETRMAPLREARMAPLREARMAPLREARMAPLRGDASLAAALEAALGVEVALDALDAKFVVRVDGGPVSIETVDGDLAINAAGVALGGWRASAADPVGAVLRCCRALARRGASRARDVDDPAALLATLGLDPEPANPPAPASTIGAFGWGIGLAPRLGQLAPGDLTRLAALAEGSGEGSLRVTPFRSILVPGAAAAALGRAAAAGFVVRADDPSLRIRACIGAPGCLSGQAPARAVAADYLDRVPPRGILHLSGCAKGCAHPGPAARLFVGENGALREQAA